MSKPVQLKLGVPRIEMKRTLGVDMPGLWKIIHQECGWPTGTMTNIGYMIGDPRSGHSEKRCEHCDRVLHAENVQLIREEAPSERAGDKPLPLGHEFVPADACGCPCGTSACHYLGNSCEYPASVHEPPAEPKRCKHGVRLDGPCSACAEESEMEPAQPNAPAPEPQWAYGAIDNTFKDEGIPFRRFYLRRMEDKTGVSRTGRVLEGVLTQGGKVFVEWRPPHSTMGIYNSMAEFLIIHVDCHPSCNEVVWLDE